MRLISLVPAAFVLLIAGSAFAQEWIEYVSRADFFSVNFPAQPEVRDIKWETEYGLTLPGRMHIHTDGRSRYSVTVIDYGKVQQPVRRHILLIDGEGYDFIGGVAHKIIGNDLCGLTYSIHHQLFLFGHEFLKFRYSE